MSLDLSDLAFEAAPRDADAIAAETLTVDVQGFEGPLDMLLAMARTQKVDLRNISILALAEQYLAFVAEAERLRIELAADYLVMAAWLAWLKSRLLLPEPEPGEEATGEEMAARLAFQLERLDAMRKCAANLMARDRLGRDVFARGAPEALTVRKRTRWEASLADLLGAYARIRTREEYRPLQVDRRSVYSLEAALERLRGLVGDAVEWSDLAAFLPRIEPRARRSALASCFAATLEIARRGEIELAQEATFAPLKLRRRTADA
jgi:segregation and condensation protein A